MARSTQNMKPKSPYNVLNRLNVTKQLVPNNTYSPDTQIEGMYNQRISQGESMSVEYLVFLPPSSVCIKSLYNKRCQFTS